MTLSKKYNRKELALAIQGAELLQQMLQTELLIQDKKIPVQKNVLADMREVVCTVLIFLTKEEKGVSDIDYIRMQKAIELGLYCTNYVISISKDLKGDNDE